MIYHFCHKEGYSHQEVKASINAIYWYEQWSIKNSKNRFEKFFKLMNNAVSGKTMQNVRKHRDIKIVSTEKRRNYLVSEPTYHTTTFFIENLFAVEMKITQILMNKPVYLGLSLLEASKY